MTGKKFYNVSAIALSLAVFAMVSTPADARRGGSIGSRGSRTYTAPPSTRTAPNQVAPVQRTSTERTTPAAAAPQTNAARQGAPGSKMGGMAKGLIGGLVAGGLIGMLMGNGLGALGGSGMLMALLQIALLAGVIWFAIRMFRRRSSMAAAAPGIGSSPMSNPMGGQQFAFSPKEEPRFGNVAPAAPMHTTPHTRELNIGSDDKEAFERLLFEVQDAYGREDFTRLRACTTPEVMAYFAEEITGNATRGLRNNVEGTELLEAEVAEAWNEAGTDYATIAMQYQSIDVMVDRVSGAVVEGDASAPTRTTELWTFARTSHGTWRLSAIQDAR